MRIYLDTADKNEITSLMQWGSFCGITTNPIILNNSGLKTEQAIENLAPLFDGDFFVQTWGETSSEMSENAMTIAKKLGQRAIIKIPITEEGLKTIYKLSKKRIRTAATALATPGQAILAMEAGVDIVIPFYNRIEESGGNAVEIIKTICNLCCDSTKAKTLIASLKKPEQIFKLPNNIFGITIPPQLARELLKSPLTENIVNRFKETSI